MDPEDDKKNNSHRCVKTFLSIGNTKMHEIFRKRWYIYKNQKWIDGGDCNNELIKLSESLPYSMKKALTIRLLDQWDITTTNQAIQIISKEISAKGVKINYKEENFIRTIRGVRNDLTHINHDGKLSDDEHKIYMNRLKSAYKKYGIKKDDIFEEEQKAMLKTGLLKAKNANEVQNGIKDIQNENSPATNAEKIKSEYESCGSTKDRTKADDGAKLTKRATSLPEIDLRRRSRNFKIQFQRLKKYAIELFKGKKFTEAIAAFNQILQLPNLSHQDQARIFSYQSVAHLSLKTNESFQAAKEDAEGAIQLWPCWWRGYYRLGRAQVKLHELEEAKKSFEKALALNNSAQEVMNDLSAVKSILGLISREEHFKPGVLPPSKEEQIKEIQTGFGRGEIV